MKTVGLGKRQGFTNETSQSLAQGVEPALDMVGFAAVFADRLMTVSGKHALIRVPGITERVATGVGAWNAPPELQTTVAVRSPMKWHNLACAAAQGNPHPALIGLPEHERPHVIQLQHIFRLSSNQRRFQWGQVLRPGLNPVGDGTPQETKQALDAPQTEAFQHRAFHLSAHPLIISWLSVQRAIARAALAVIFLVAFVIMAVSHQVFTATFRAPMRYNRLYHEKVLQADLAVCSGLPFHALSVKTSPLPP